MNILFQFDDPIIASSGGVERVTDTLAKELIKRGHNVSFLCHQKMCLLDEDIEQSADQYFIDLSQSRNDIKKRVANIIKSHKTEYIITQNPNYKQLNIAKMFPKFIKKVFVCHTQPYSFDSFDRKRISELKPINCKHQLFLTIARLFPIFYKAYFAIQTNMLFRRIFAESDKFCFISSSFYHRIENHIKIPRNKLFAIPNPNTFSVTYENTPKERLILWIGRVENNGKNAIGFIKMWELFSKKNIGWNAIMIGSGPDLETNQKYVENHNIENITFTGKISNVQDYYKRARFVVVTSWSESWSMVLTEGMSYGCIPCAYKTYETISDIIDDKKNGIIIPIVAPQMMSDRLTELANDEDLLNVMSKESKKKVQQFSVERITDLWEHLLESLNGTTSLL